MSSCTQSEGCRLGWRFLDKSDEVWINSVQILKKCYPKCAVNMGFSTKAQKFNELWRSVDDDPGWLPIICNWEELVSRKETLKPWVVARVTLRNQVCQGNGPPSVRQIVTVQDEECVSKLKIWDNMMRIKVISWALNQILTGIKYKWMVNLECCR